jgi:hypothetical protein
MPIPQVDRNRVIDAMTKFDREERDLPAWKRWETDENYKYALNNSTGCRCTEVILQWRIRIE